MLAPGNKFMKNNTYDFFKCLCIFNLCIKDKLFLDLTASVILPFPSKPYMEEEISSNGPEKSHEGV